MAVTSTQRPGLLCARGPSRLHAHSCPSSSPTKPPSGALILGAGPSGMATALILARRGWRDVTVLEQLPAANTFDVNRAFTYTINLRGQELTDSLGLTHELAKRGLASTEVEFFTLGPGGPVRRASMMGLQSSKKPAYWITRRNMNLILYQKLENEFLENGSGRVEMVFGVRGARVEREGEGGRIEVIAEGPGGEALRFAPRLLVAADGARSTVRETLEEWDCRFGMKKLDSGAAGLRFKVLPLRPMFPIGKGGSGRAEPCAAYMVPGVSRSGQKIRLGILPTADAEEPRTANVILRPWHEFWSLRTGREVFDYLQAAVPQVSIGDMASMEDVEGFAARSGGRFPRPQHAGAMQHLAGKGEHAQGVVLVGDAAHAFPPDLGQGVNSAFQDVLALDRALQGANDDVGKALPVYESTQLANAEALVRLMVIGAPWQYGQNLFRLKLWGVSVKVRAALAKALPGIVYPHVRSMVGDPSLSYVEVLRREQRSVAALGFLGLLALLLALAVVRLIRALVAKG
ncbi:unnamed protein product [Ostreobium quekettii]|uniref:FAD-binding domain-containing protein n=1 Tax=Ostreobium quekettii TaxID=121088 RepID=A0A8S1JF12_9CHLO|nr:unnamed protein product [Ostreobium quekettii]|eukprot:evm.model.scf_62EXC.8 EVM.evm.TU.scf_62EXC.8   scf_62EXC:160969-162519(+)